MFKTVLNKLCPSVRHVGVKPGIRFLSTSVRRLQTAPTVEVVVRNSCQTIGEGPHWEESSQSLLYVDMFKGHIHRYTPETNTEEILDLEVDAVTAIIPCKTGGYIVNNPSAIKHLDWDTRQLTTIAEIEQEFDHLINDAKCDAKGRYWTGTMPKLHPPDKQPDPPFPEGSCGIYSIDTDGTIKKHHDNILLSNGIAWSLDNKTMYFVDSFACKLFAFDYDLEAGSISNQRTVYEQHACHGYMDGITIDTDNMLWIALFGAGKVLRLDPQSGKELESVIIPGQMNTTSCCFGGKDYSDLYVTSAKQNPLETEERIYEPTAGSLFKVTGTGAKGLPAYECGLRQI